MTLDRSSPDHPPSLAFVHCILFGACSVGDLDAGREGSTDFLPTGFFVLILMLLTRHPYPKVTMPH